MFHGRMTAMMTMMTWRQQIKGLDSRLQKRTE
eukprot:COSAG06_NODE_2197_length_7373_cov_2.328568_3_plen_32_part_00